MGRRDDSDDSDDGDRDHGRDHDDGQPGGHDVVLVHGKTEDGVGIRALRSRPGRLEAAELRPLKEGQPLGSGEIVALRDRAGSPLLWDVDVLYERGGAGEAAPSRAGPPKVANARYRRNWDSIFGRPEEPGKKALN